MCNLLEVAIIENHYERLCSVAQFHFHINHPITTHHRIFHAYFPLSFIPICSRHFASRTCVHTNSICLPMEARDSLDIVYLVSIMAVNGLAFCIIAICYARMYFSLDKGTRHAVTQVSRGEMTVAKKMALLVFTNFACWAPIAFFGLTALAGFPMIDVAKSKILLVFFYPLNSCADPYLYAILTSQYRRDLFVLLSK